MRGKKGERNWIRRKAKDIWFKKREKEEKEGRKKSNSSGKDVK